MLDPKTDRIGEPESLAKAADRLGRDTTGSQGRSI